MEKVAVGKLEQMQKTSFCLLVTFNRSVGKDMMDGQSTFAEMRRHQYAPMAIKRVFLGAHQCQTHLRSALDDTFNAAPEGRRA